MRPASLLLFLATQMAFAQTLRPVTLRLDMRGDSIAPSGISVAGDFQAALGGNNWTPGAQFLGDPDQDSIYEISFLLPEGLYAYKFINGSSWSDENELLGPACGRSDGGGNFNRDLHVGKNGADLPPHSFDGCEGLVRFRVDMSDEAVDANGVFVSGDWVEQAGYGSLWEVDALQMYDYDADEIYTAIAYVQDTNHQRYLFYNGTTAADAEAVPAPCASPTALVARWFDGDLQPQELDAVCFGQCETCDKVIDTNYATYWWNEAVFYEIFVRSFYDSDGNGIGDFQGIIQKLDYLNDGDPNTTDDLGITGIWLMPIMPSPSYHGYDVTDYEGINPDYGSMADFEEFLDSAHARGIKVVIDFVMNHASSQHPHFLSSANNPNGPHANDFIWTPVDSGYSGPWGQQVWHSWGNRHYYGLFWGGMPDWNYDEPAVKNLMFDAADFWLNKGVDGFRLDAIKYLDEDFPQMENTPETFQILRDYKQRILANNPNAYSVGEVWSSTANVVPYVDTSLLDMCFEFDLAGTLLQTVNQSNAAIFNNNFAPIVNAYPELQLAPFLTNHDQDRVFSVFGQDMLKMKQAAALLMTMPGTPYIYYGEEVGMIGTGAHENIRRPMQWNTSLWAGFTSGTPWIGVNGNYGQYNVAVMETDSTSLLNTYRQLIHLRNGEPSLQKGYSLLLQAAEPNLISFARILGSEGVIIVSNLGNGSEQPSLSLAASTLAEGSYQAIDLLSGDTVGTMQISSTGAISVSNFTASIGARATWILSLEPQSGISISEEQERESDFLKVYPNPARQEVHIDLTNWQGNVEMDMIDLSGRSVRQWRLPAGSVHILDMASVSRGQYLLRCEGDVQAAVQRLILR